MNRYNLSLLLLTLAVMPLFYVSGWLSVAALIAIYGLVTRLANKDFDRRSARSIRLHPDVLRRLTPPHRDGLKREASVRNGLESGPRPRGSALGGKRSRA